MAGMHRTRGRRRTSVALLSAATVTATAFTVGVEPPQVVERVSTQGVDLAAAIRLLPNSNQVPDVTGGLGTAIYDASQALADSVIRALVNGINVGGLAQAAGVDPHSVLTGLLAKLPANLLPGILASLSLDVPVLGPVLNSVSGGDTTLLTTILDVLKVKDVTDGTLTGLLDLLGLNLSDPLNLGGLAVPGLNVVTAGPTFTALKLFGLDLGWVPSLPNSVANEINGSGYAKLGVDGVLNLVLGKLEKSTLPGAAELVNTLSDLIAKLADPVPDAIDVRVVPTVGIGLGAFAAAQAYAKVLARLASEPGGSAYVGTDPVLGSLTILPLVLINNPSRPDGGALARFGPLASLFGISTVNPKTQATNSGDGQGPEIPLLGTGVKLGNANLLPILIDATYEYEPLSDLAAWPNSVTLLNNLAAGLLPTYLLRGLSLDGLGDQVLGQVKDLAAQSATSGNPLALNVYLTLHSKTLPLLEPLYLVSDFLNIVGLSPLAQLPMRLANALAPALTILTNIGYTNVNQADGYSRDPSTAGTETPFLSFPSVDYGKVVGDTVTALFGGFQKEFFSNNPTTGTPNVLKNLLDAISDGSLVSAPAASTQQVSASSVPATNAQLFSLSAPQDSAVGAKKTTVDDSTTSTAPAPQVDSVKVADPTEAKHAPPDEDPAPVTEVSPDPKPAKPELNVVRDSLNASPTNDGKTVSGDPGKSDPGKAPEVDKTEPAGAASSADGSAGGPAGGAADNAA